VCFSLVSKYFQNLNLILFTLAAWFRLVNWNIIDCTLQLIDLSSGALILGNLVFKVCRFLCHSYKYLWFTFFQLIASLSFYVFFYWTRIGRRTRTPVESISARLQAYELTEAADSDSWVQLHGCHRSRLRSRRRSRWRPSWPAIV